MNKPDDDDILQVAKVVPEVYDDGLKPVVKATGETLALIPKSINAALAPLRQWIDKREFNVAATKKLLQSKLEKIGANHIVTPEPYVAVPALQAISYAMSSEILRNLYANLLACSMNDSMKNRVHPSFVEIIKQLSPDEAKLISCLVNVTNLPLIDVRHIASPKRNYSIVVRNFTDLADNVCENHNPENIAKYIDNLCRLKITDIPTGIYIANQDVYNHLEDNPIIVNIIKKKLPEGQRWEISKKGLCVTAFGKEFIDVCVKNN